MNEPTKNLAQHLDPTTDKFNTTGIALLAEGHDPIEIRDFYHGAGRIPDVHPVVLYEVKQRRTDGDKLVRTYISLDESRVLEMGTHIIHVLCSRFRFEAKEEDIELARETLNKMGVLGYTITPTSSSGTKVKRTVNIKEQIEYLLGLHLANPVRES